MSGKRRLFKSLQERLDEQRIKRQQEQLVKGERLQDMSLMLKMDFQMNRQPSIIMQDGIMKPWIHVPSRSKI